MLVKKMLLCIKIYIAENYYKIYTKNEPKQNKGENDSILYPRSKTYNP